MRFHLFIGSIALRQPLSLLHQPPTPSISLPSDSSPSLTRVEAAKRIDSLHCDAARASFYAQYASEHTKTRAAAKSDVHHSSPSHRHTYTTMADEATTTAPVDAQAVSHHVESVRASSPLTVVEPATVTEPAEATPADGETTVTKENEEIAGKQATTEVTAPDGDTTEVAEGTGASDATPASGKKEKRKSTGGVPEHKSKKLNKKKSMIKLNLDCKPGEFYWARLKGYPPWPAIICDEEMLPESLLASRPVSTARPDGSLRADFQEGGKNAKERTFPIMFLSTNEL